MGELFASDVLAKTESKEEKKVQKNVTEKEEIDMSEWSSGLDEADDENLYFSPEQGNVAFASAVDGWAFGCVLLLFLFIFYSFYMLQLIYMHSIIL